jgi:hypothetical protein
MNRDELRAMRESEKAAVEKVRAVRAMDQPLPHDEHHRRELSNFPRDWLAPLLAELGISRSSLEAYVADSSRLHEFWHSIPGVDVMTHLMLARDRNPDAQTHDNDVRELTFMRLAVPYANVLLAENLWAHLANATGLASRYETTVVSELARLPDALRDQGCLPA